MATASPVTGFIRSGKVRDLYGLEDGTLLLVASDRVSAFDVVLPTLIPDKGRVLTGLSRHWFYVSRQAGLIGDHLLGTDPASLPPGSVERLGLRPDDLRGRMMHCRPARVLPAEMIIRGYLAGSGWKEYREVGSVCGVHLPAGLRESDQLPQAIFTPTTKADAGHDEPMDFDTLASLVGADLAERARTAALALYTVAAEQAERVGIIVADTKFELGLVDGPAGEELILVDEVLTPDSSRFWPAESYRPGGPQPSFDKQPLRDWLEASGWAKQEPGPALPAGVVAETRERYVAAYERLTGDAFSAEPGAVS